MDFTDLRHLLVAIEAGNLLRAGELLGIKPSTISRRLTRMEDEVGVTIVERGAFGIRPTVAGREIVIQVRRALDSFDNVLRAGKKQRRGQERPDSAWGPHAAGRPTPAVPAGILDRAEPGRDVDTSRVE